MVNLCVFRSGYSYLKVVSSSLADPKVTVNEYGHALTYHERYWVDMKRTGAWWEPYANWFADTYMTSPLCAASRAKFKQQEGRTIMDLNKVLGSSHQVLVDASAGSGNYYQSWPFLAYLTNNPDNYPGLGKGALRDMIRKYKKGSNETPLHALQTVLGDVKVQAVVGRYWARMANVDIGHKQGQELFQRTKARINFSNLDASGGGSYKVKANKAPRYMGANIIPLNTSGGSVNVKVTSSGPFVATLAIKSKAGSVKYVDLPGGSGQGSVAAGDEASLVVAHTPALIQYDGFSVSSGPVAQGLQYQVQLTGATA
jgi:hypothetical protein